jgi:phosphatidylinositol-3-phosphatase
VGSAPPGRRPPPSRRRAPTRRPRLVPALAAAAALTALAALAGCGSPTPALPIQTRPAPKARLTGGPPRHIAVIVMENEEYGDLLGSSSVPYINRLAREYGLATNLYAITHPSLPNYLALTGGSTFGINSDCTDCHVGVPGLAAQLDTARISWKAYMEDLPHSCFTGADANSYAKKHDPFVYYTDTATDRARCSHVVSFTEIALDERANRLPMFIWITPNLCHDMHDCNPATGDRFLSRLIPPLLKALGRRSLLFLTWDEGSSDNGCCRLASGGHVLTIVAGSAARAHARLGTPVDHYSVLQTIEDLLGLPRLRGAACACTPTLAPLLATP